MRVAPLLGRFGYGVARIVLPAEPYRAPNRPLSLSRGLIAAGGELLREGRLARHLLWDCSLATFLVVLLASLMWTSLRHPDQDGVLIVAFETPAPERIVPPFVPAPGPQPQPEPEPVRQPEPEPIPVPEPPRERTPPEPLLVTIAPPPPVPAATPPPAPAPRPKRARQRSLPKLEALGPLPAAVPEPAPRRLVRAERAPRPSLRRPSPRVDPLAAPAEPPAIEVPRWRAARERTSRPATGAAPIPTLAPAAPLVQPSAPSLSTVRSERPTHRPEPRRGPMPKLDTALAAPAYIASSSPATRARRSLPSEAPRPMPTLSARELALPAAGRSSAPAVPASPASSTSRSTRAPAARSAKRSGRRGRRLRGVPLGSLAACVSDREEEALKQRLIAAVTTQSECTSEAGRYRFLETRNLNAFLMTVERAASRAEADRCTELAYALDCVVGSTRRASSRR